MKDVRNLYKYYLISICYMLEGYSFLIMYLPSPGSLYLVKISYTANIYSQFTVIGCVTCASVIWQRPLQAMTVHMTFNDTEEYSLRSIAILGSNTYIKITVAHVTLPKLY